MLFDIWFQTASSVESFLPKISDAHPFEQNHQNTQSSTTD
jgi:hypothetical protein